MPFLVLLFCLQGEADRREIALDAALQFIARTQKEDGSWDPRAPFFARLATTAINGLALIRSGAYPDRVTRCRKYLIDEWEAFEKETVYSGDRFLANVWTAFFFAEVGEKGILERVRDWLYRHQKRGGGWHYDAGQSVYMTAVVVILLARMEAAGLAVRQAVKDRAAAWFRRAQQADGGFDYYGSGGSRRGAQVGRTAAAWLAMTRLGLAAEANRSREFIRAHLVGTDTSHAGPALHFWMVSMACREAGLWKPFWTMARDRILDAQNRAGDIYRVTSSREKYPQPVYTTPLYALTLMVARS